MTAYDQYYQAFLLELAAVGPPAAEGSRSDIDRYIGIARRYRDSLPLTGIRITQAEFFKVHYLRFQTELRYYEWCAAAHVSWPTEDGFAVWKAFWIQESNRRYEFMETYPALHTYWISGATERDEELFGGQADTARHNAEVIAEFLALDRYERYLERAFSKFFTNWQQ